MMQNSHNYTDTTEIATDLDILSETLRSMRVTGSLLLRENYLPPWAVQVPDANQIASLLSPAKAASIAAFHLVQNGRLELRLGNNDPETVKAGELVICFAGMTHTLFQQSDNNALPFQELLTNNNPFAPTDDTASSSTSLICGVFMLHNTFLNPLFATLPAVLKVSFSEPSSPQPLTSIVELLLGELDQNASGGKYVVERYLEILCAEAIRSYSEQLPANTRDWFQGLKDPVISKAIGMIHTDPGHPWTVKKLADSVAISPSRFAARFTASIGESPMIYVTKWRMYIAGKLLREKRKTVEQTAGEVGYENIAAFSRAFKRHVGSAPKIWRAGVRE